MYVRCSNAILCVLSDKPRAFESRRVKVIFNYFRVLCDGMSGVNVHFRLPHVCVFISLRA